MVDYIKNMENVSLSVMSIDRYLVVLATVRSKRMPYRTYRAAKIISLCVWILVILIVMPFTVFASVFVNPNDGRKSCVLSFPSPESLWFKASRIYTLIMGFAIPVSTICILYTMMLYKLRNMRLNSNAKALDKAKKKVTIMVFIVLAVCLFCWTPFHLSTIVALTTDLRTTPLLIGISYFITSLSYANSCLNPFLYAFLDDSFRKAFKKIAVDVPFLDLEAVQGVRKSIQETDGRRQSQSIGQIMTLYKWRRGKRLPEILITCHLWSHDPRRLYDKQIVFNSVTVETDGVVPGGAFMC
ncbi:hypothetical protein INR49_023169 [Caranx melampygus]|nr:hypothetical protein INR49_023169 [Caranx melampygus]